MYIFIVHSNTIKEEQQIVIKDMRDNVAKNNSSINIFSFFHE